MCAGRQTTTNDVDSMGQVPKDGAMPQAVLLIHGAGAKAKVVKDALLNSLDGFFIVESVELCSDGLR
jgi:hypothetical protein